MLVCDRKWKGQRQGLQEVAGRSQNDVQCEVGGADRCESEVMSRGVLDYKGIFWKISSDQF